MLKKLILLLSLALAVTFAAGAETTVELHLIIKKAYSSLSTGSGVEVVYKFSAKQEVFLSGPKSKIDNTQVTVKNDVLSIFAKDPNATKGLSGVKAVVCGPVIPSYRASSGSSISVEADLDMKGSDVSASASSGALVVMKKVVAHEFKADASSGASITIDGVKASEIEAEASSGSSLSLANIDASSFEADASSGSSITVSGTATAADLEASSGSLVSASGLRVTRYSKKVSSGASMTYPVRPSR